MPEIKAFVRHGAERVTPATIANIHKQLPLLKAEFTQIHAPTFPHLVDQLELLADVVEDYAENVIPDVPLVAVAEAVFALIYAHRRVDLIPDSIGPLGRADDSAVVRCVLIDHEKWFARYAEKRGLDYSTITTLP